MNYLFIYQNISCIFEKLKFDDNGFDADAGINGQFCPNRFEMGQLLTHVQDTISI